MPTTLSAVVAYANERSGIDRVFTDNCLAAIEANRSRYEDLVTGERRDDSPFSDAGPGIPDASPTFPDAGPDGYLPARLTDPDASESMPGCVLLAGGAEPAGGHAGLRSSDTEPPRAEKRNTTAVAEDIIDPLRPLEAAILNAPGELFGDAELGTVTLRRLTE